MKKLKTNDINQNIKYLDFKAILPVFKKVLKNSIK